VYFVQSGGCFANRLLMKVVGVFIVRFVRRFILSGTILQSNSHVT
jgi:hypothetical protein